MSQSLRIDEGQSAARSRILFTFDGETISGLTGDTIGAAVWAAGKKVLRTSPTSGTPRGMFCAMGSCQECVIRVEGRVRTACNTSLAPGMTVHSVNFHVPAA